VRLIVCWDTFKSHPLLGKHPCGIAYHALRDAGYDPEVKYAFGWTKLPDFLNLTPGRREAKRLTGSVTVPVLITDDGEVVAETRPIKQWAREHPASSQARRARGAA
jgi:hypothetical protein